MTGGHRIGVRANLAQFSLLVGVNALVGGMVGQERAVLPLLAGEAFGVRAFSAVLSFVAVFGLVKAAANLVAGVLADRWGRKPVLVLGWLAGLPVPLLVMWAPSWSWVVAANALLGVNQGLAWSATLVMKIDLAGPERRNLAMGLNESAGYLAVAATALATGAIASEMGLRPAPFLLGLAYAGLGLGLSTLVVKETRGHARQEAAELGTAQGSAAVGELGAGQVFVLTTVRDRALSAVTQAGLVNNLNDGVAWGLFPLLFAGAGLSASSVGVLTAIYPAVWGVGQLAAGPLSDRWGRKWLIVAGMWVQASAIVAVAAASGFAGWAVATALLGVGTAMVYPTLLAAVGRRPPPMAGVGGGRLPALARPGLCRRRPSRRCGRRRVGHSSCGRLRRCRHGRFRCRSGPAHVRDAPAPRRRGPGAGPAGPLCTAVTDRGRATNGGPG